MALRSLFTQLVVRSGMTIIAALSVFWLDGSLFEDAGVRA